MVKEAHRILSPCRNSLFFICFLYLSDIMTCDFIIVLCGCISVKCLCLKYVKKIVKLLPYVPNLKSQNQFYLAIDEMKLEHKIDLLVDKIC